MADISGRTRQADPVEHLKQQAAGVFAICMQRNSTLNRLVGKMPDLSSAKNTIEKQTSAHLPIVRCTDLGVGKGDEIQFNLIQPTKAYPIMGADRAEGNETGLSLGEDRLRINQARFPLDLGDTMKDISDPVQLSKVGRPIALSLMNRYCDQSYLVHLAGARGFHDNTEWVLPLANDANFEKIMVNPVKAPTKNRHFIASGDGVQAFSSAVSGGALSVQSTDLLTMDTVDSMKTVLDSIALPPPVVIFEGDKAALDSPLRVWLMSPAQYNRFAADPQFRQIQATAIARASLAKNHPVFLNEAGIWGGFLIIKTTKPIRFYKGNAMKYCNEFNTETESSVNVPDALGDDFAIDRSLILGGQSLMEGFGKSEHTGIPFFFKQREDDYGDKHGLLIGAIRGTSKIRFKVNVAGDTVNPEYQFTDNGVIAVDTVVKLNGVR